MTVMITAKMLVFRRNMVTATLYQICTHRHTHHDCRHIARSVLGINIMIHDNVSFNKDSVNKFVSGYRVSFRVPGTNR